MGTIDINQLRNEIKIDEESLNEKKAVLRYLESRGHQGSVKIKHGASEILEGGVIELDKIKVQESSKQTLLDKVTVIIKRFGDQEFSVAHLDILLQQQEVKDKSGKFFTRSRISTALSKLVNDGVIICTLQGKGNLPFRYKLNEKKV